MPRSCIICNHPERSEIENAILAITASALPSDVRSIEHVAEQYNVPLDVLKTHALFHTPLVSTSDVEMLKFEPAAPADTNDKKPERDSLTRRMKLREADLLAEVGNEYLVTLKTMGRRINKLAQVSSLDVEDAENELKLAKLLTKPMVDLYVGMGSEIRQTVKTMAEMDRLLNGPEDTAATGLMALAKAIQGSDPSNG